MSGNQHIRLVHADVAVFTHDVLTTVVTHEGTETLRERETIVLRRDGDGWSAVHEHLSPAPE